MNRITIAGHLGADPESRFTSTGKKVTTLRVATKARKKGQDVTIWWRVTIWDEQFDKMLPHLKKGSPIIVYGEVEKPEIFQDREGKPQVSMDIRAIDIQFSPFGKPEGRAPGSEQSGQQAAAPFGTPLEAQPLNPYTMGNFSQSAAPTGVAQGQGHSFDDEVPF